MKQTDFDQDLINTLRSLKTEKRANPSVFFKENAEIRLMNLIADEEKVLEKKPGFVFVKNPKFAFRLAGVFLIILIFISTGTILAAQSATPKDKLYSVKLASEEIALKLLPPSSLKANVSVEIVKRRADEIDSEKKNNDKAEIKQGIARYKNSIKEAKKWNHQSLLEEDEKNLDSLTAEYEDLKKENNPASEEKVKGASDSNINLLEQSRENSGIKSPIEQTNNQETIKEETKTTEELTATPSPEEKH